MAFGPQAPPSAQPPAQDGLPSAAGVTGVEPAIALARRTENVAVGDELVRHRLSTRVIHWTVAVSFFACLFTGLPIWTPIFGWTARLLGGLAVCRWLHPWAGIVFFGALFVMFVHWIADMRFRPEDRGWLKRRLSAYFHPEREDVGVGKYNAGQKLLFFLAALLALALLASGVVLWFPYEFTEAQREASWVLHDGVFILFAVLIVAHIYLATASEPGTFRAMTRGTVTRAWARLHHPQWYRDVTGDEKKSS
jgi:formate dehydrogenase subunit gamma